MYVEEISMAILPTWIFAGARYNVLPFHNCGTIVDDGLINVAENPV